MAVVTTKSVQITNRDARPVVQSNGRITRGDVARSADVVAIANGDSSTSKYIFTSVPSNAIPVSVRVTCPDIGTTTAGDIGLYRTTNDGSAAVDADFFASALSLSGGALTKSEAMFESGVVTVANANKPLWEQLGLTTDPKVYYDVVLTLTANADAAGSVFLEVDWVQ